MPRLRWLVVALAVTLAVSYSSRAVPIEVGVDASHFALPEKPEAPT